MQHLLVFCLMFCLISSLWCLALCHLDKSAARRGKRRVPERRFFLLAAFGGGCGLWLGMRLFRHKTRHWYFRWGLPAILLLQLGLVWFVWEYGVELL